MVVHELSICISSKQTVMLFVLYMHACTCTPGKIDGELIMPKAVITPGSHFYQGRVIYVFA